MTTYPSFSFVVAFDRNTVSFWLSSASKHLCMSGICGFTLRLQAPTLPITIPFGKHPNNFFQTYLAVDTGPAPAFILVWKWYPMSRMFVAFQAGRHKWMNENKSASGSANRPMWSAFNLDATQEKCFPFQARARQNPFRFGRFIGKNLFSIYLGARWHPPEIYIKDGGNHFVSILSIVPAGKIRIYWWAGILFLPPRFKYAASRTQFAVIIFSDRVFYVYRSVNGVYSFLPAYALMITMAGSSLWCWNRQHIKQHLKLHLADVRERHGVCVLHQRPSLWRGVIFFMTCSVAGLILAGQC